MTNGRICLGCDNLFDSEDERQHFCCTDCHEATISWRDKPIICDYCEASLAHDVDLIEQGRYTRVVACWRCIALLRDQLVFSFHDRRAFVRNALARLAAGLAV